MHRATQKSRLQTSRSPVWPGLIAALGVAFGQILCAETPPAPETVAHEAYTSAKAKLVEAAEDPTAAWQLGRACFDWAEFATNDAQRASLAREGMAACEQALRADTNLAPAHYYLGMNQGQMARTMSLGALKLVREMEAHFKRAREVDAAFDEAGPDRNLGLLYLQAPGWPVSLGSRARARSHLSQAVKRAPHFPENRLNLMEAYASWNETESVNRELKAWDKVAETAQREFNRDQWHWNWLNWERRLAALRQLTADPPPRARSPKDRD